MSCLCLDCGVCFVLFFCICVLPLHLCSWFWCNTAARSAFWLVPHTTVGDRSFEFSAHYCCREPRLGALLSPSQVLWLMVLHKSAVGPGSAQYCRWNEPSIRGQPTLLLTPQFSGPTQLIGPHANPVRSWEAHPQGCTEFPSLLLALHLSSGLMGMVI